jgi:predicted phage terminase large subunit-like protein
VRFRGQCGLVKAAWFKHYTPGELPEAFQRIVQSWDTANKATELSDFSVCTTWGIAGKDLYLLDVLRRRMEYPELKRAVREQHERFGPSVVLIEEKPSGIQLIQELIGEGLHLVSHYQPQTDKIMRMHAQTAMIENGFVRVPDTAPWLTQYLPGPPNGKHDDQAIRPRRCSTGSSEAAPHLQRRYLRALPAARRGASPRAGAGPSGAAARVLIMHRLHEDDLAPPEREAAARPDKAITQASAS